MKHYRLQLKLLLALLSAFNLVFSQQEAFSEDSSINTDTGVYNVFNNLSGYEDSIYEADINRLHIKINIFTYETLIMRLSLYYDDTLVSSVDSFYFSAPVKFNEDTFVVKSKSFPYQFTNCFFSSDLKIKNCNYPGYLLFANSTFGECASIFNDSRSKNPIYEHVNCGFQGCKFHKGICFNNRNVNASNLVGSVFKEALYFGDCKIQGVLDLSHCIFDSTSNINFDGNNQIDTIDLSYAKFGSVITVSNIKPTKGKICAIYLTGADISKLQFQYQNFKLLFPSSYYTDDNYSDIVSSTYEALLGNFTTNGYKESFEKLDIEYHDYKYRKIGFCGFVLPHWWNCYGYHKEWIFLWTLGLLGLFTFFTTFIYESLNKDIKDDGVYYIATIPTDPSTIRERVRYSLMYTSNLFFQISLETKNLNFKRRRVFYVIIVYTVGILCVGYIANFVLQK